MEGAGAASFREAVGIRGAGGRGAGSRSLASVARAGRLEIDQEPPEAAIVRGFRLAGCAQTPIGPAWLRAELEGAGATGRQDKTVLAYVLRGMDSDMPTSQRRAGGGGGVGDCGRSNRRGSNRRGFEPTRLSNLVEPTRFPKRRASWGLDEEAVGHVQQQDGLGPAGRGGGGGV